MLKIKNRFLKNMSWMLASKIFHMLISLLVGIITARFLGPSGYGVINYVASYVVFFSAVCNLGLNSIIINEIVKGNKDEGLIVGTVLGMRLIVSFIGTVFFIALMFFIDSSPVFIIVSILQSLSLLFSSYECITFWYQSKYQSKIPTILSVIAYLLTSIYKVYIVITQKSIEWFAFSSSLDLILIAIFLLVAYHLSKGAKLKFSIKYGFTLIKQSYHFILAGLMVAIYAQTDKIMIGSMLGNEQVGLYSVAIVICGFIGFIPESIINAIRPIIMETKLLNEELYLKRIRQTYTVIIWISLLYGIFVSIFSKWIILIIYGNQYINAQSSLKIAVWYCAFSYIGSIKNIWLLCEGYQKYEVVFTFFGALMNVVLNYILIPLFGIAGAALATLFSQFFTNFLMPMFFKKTRKLSMFVIDGLFLQKIDLKENMIKMLKKIKSKR